MTTSTVVSAEYQYKSRLETLATSSRLASSTPLINLATAGKRIVALGLHDDIVYSIDESKRWAQASDPVNVDPVTISFVDNTNGDNTNGWAIGHYGRIIWTKPLDGKPAVEITRKYSAAKVGMERTPKVEHAIRQKTALVEKKNTQSLLDVTFKNDREGYVIDTFNHSFSIENGGKPWTPHLDRTDNPKELYFYSTYPDAKAAYLTGKQGMAWHLDKTKKKFAMQMPYNGMSFDLIVDDGTLHAYGMRGSLLRSSSEDKSWQLIQLNNQVDITGSVVLLNRKIALTNQVGPVFLSRDHGKNFQSEKMSNSMSHYGISPIPDHRVMLVGSAGVRAESRL